MPNVLTVRGLKKSYGTQNALAGIDFDVRAGEVFALIGPNGAGKTTTLRIVATLLTSSGGEITFLDRDHRKEPDFVREKISYLPEEAGAYKDMKGGPRVDDATSPDYYLMFRFLAFDLGRVKAMVKSQWETVSAANPEPSVLSTMKTTFWVENHRHERHEPLAPHLQTVMDPVNGKKYADIGISRPSWDPDDPQMQSNYIDWYQEVRQHDVMRNYFPYENGHQWLLEQGEDLEA